MTTGVAILGSTGSIGTSTLRVIARQPDRFRAVALTAFSSAQVLDRQATETGATYVGLVGTNGSAATWSRGVPGRGVGRACLVEAATHPDVDIVVNAVVGSAGLEATLAALKAGKRVALANKESLVMAGELVLEAARNGGEVLPVDSEHSAVLQCMAGRRPEELSRLILTASGGPFRQWSSAQLANVTVQDALQHPTWRMGPKITVDSATLVNKALEVIEAHYLFGLGYEHVDVVVHPQSIVHAFTEFVDGSVLAQLGFPSMELPIFYALTHPERHHDNGVQRFDPVAVGQMTFEPVRHDVFPAFALGVAAGKAGGTAPAAFNAANEVAVQAFLDGRISFQTIHEVIDRILTAHRSVGVTDLDAVLGVDEWARKQAEAACC